MHFEHLESIVWMLVTLPMMAAFVSYLYWKKTVIRRIGDQAVIKRMIVGHSPRLQAIRVALVVTATALLCVALIQPQWGETNRPIKRTGIDVVFALDLSKSMLARDVNPNRLEAAKNEIRTTLDLLGGDRVGLVVFTAISFQQSPLTTDYGAIRFYLNKLKPNQMPKGGTSVGRAIADSVELLMGSSLDQGSDAPRMKRANNQIVVLFTDGEDHESNPLEIAGRASDNGIRIVTVGIGSTQGERIPMYNESGALTGFKRDRQGELVRTKLDEATLEKIAAATGGRYIRYTGENSVANELVDYVNHLEKSEIETLLKNRYKERFVFFLLPALLLLLAAGGLGERRKHKHSRGLGVLLILLFLGSGCEDAFRSKLTAVEQGIARLNDGDPTGAIESFQRAETEIPANPRLHYDLGIAHLAAGEHETAQQKLTRALETEDLTLRFDALYNLGNSLAAQKEWKDALETYKEAIKLGLKSPADVDSERIKRAQINMEIVFRKLYPPCATFEDDLEPNDTSDAASQLEKPSREALTLCGLNDDWFKVPAIPGTSVEVTVTFYDLREELDPENPFLTAPNDVRIGLYSPRSDTPFATDNGAETDIEADLKSRRFSRAIGRTLIDESMVGTEGYVLLKVSAADNREFKYDLNIVSIPPCHALQEASEPNNTPETAQPLETDSLPLHLCGGDVDFVSVDLSPGDAFFVDVIPGDDLETGLKTALALQIVDASGRIVAEGVNESGLVTAGVRDYEGGRLYVAVSGAQAEVQGPYELRSYTFAPCPLGDDRYEDNDDAANPAELSAEEPMHRYLRICNDDLDFFKLPLAKDNKKLEIGLALVSTPRTNDPLEKTHFSLDMLSPSGDQVMVDSEVVSSPDAFPTPLQRALIVEEIDGESALFRVGADQDEFYHLIQLNPQKPPEQDQQKNDEKEQKDDSKKDEGDQPQDPQDDAQDSKPDKGDKDNSGGEDKEEKKNEAEESEGQSEDQEEEQERQEDSNGDQEQPDDTEEAQKTPQPGEPDAKQQRIADILKALEETDDNFQMKKALQNTPSSLIEKDW